MENNFKVHRSQSKLFLRNLSLKWFRKGDDYLGDHLCYMGTRGEA